MKKLSIFFVALLIFTATIFSSFTNPHTNSTDPTLNSAEEFKTLLTYFETKNSFINSDVSKAIINADEVKKNQKNEKYHFIDIRSKSWFEYGHIKGAENVSSVDLLKYFEHKIAAEEFDKIVVICYSGQSAAYYTSLLRMAGYGNVYSMKWGMSSWRVDFADNSWNKNISNDLANKLEITSNQKAAKGTPPSFVTGKTGPKAILRSRLEKAFATPYSDHLLKSSVVFENPQDYYIVNFSDQNMYDKGHLPGAIKYEPTALTSYSDLFTLPNDKPIAIYCSSGQNAAYMVAYLNVLGYDVSNVAYGANSFMNKMLKENNLNAFTKKEINMFPVIE